MCSGRRRGRRCWRDRPRFEEVVAPRSPQPAPAGTIATTWPSGCTARARPAGPRASCIRTTTSAVTVDTYAGQVLRGRAGRGVRSRRRSCSTPTASATASRFRSRSGRCGADSRPATPEVIFRRCGASARPCSSRCRRCTPRCSVRGPGSADFSSVRACVSAAEALPAAVLARWQELNGVPILDGIGSTEMLHIYCSNTLDDLRPGTCGRPVPATSCGSSTTAAITRRRASPAT